MVKREELDLDQRSQSFYNHIAGIYDGLMRVTEFFDAVEGISERKSLIDQLELNPGERFLEVASGTGSNLMLLGEDRKKSPRMVGIDISIEMLRRSQEKIASHAVHANLIAANAAHLPFPPEKFDAVLHFGGINRFSNRAFAVNEMIRVAKPGARIIISDKCLSGRRALDWRHRLIKKIKPQLSVPPPLDLIPANVRNLELNWIWGGSAYLIKFIKPGSGSKSAD